MQISNFRKIQATTNLVRKMKSLNIRYVFLLLKRTLQDSTETPQFIKAIHFREPLSAVSPVWVNYHLIFLHTD